MWNDCAPASNYLDKDQTSVCNRKRSSEQVGPGGACMITTDFRFTGHCIKSNVYSRVLIHSKFFAIRTHHEVPFNVANDVLITTRSSDQHRKYLRVRR